MGAHLNIIPLAHPASAHILVNENITAFFKFVRRAQVLGIIVFAIGTDAVRGAVHQKRVRGAGGIFGHINRCKKALSVAHGDAEFIFGIVGAHVVLGGWVRRRLLRSGYRNGKCENGQNGDEKGAKSVHREPLSPEL